ncbi:MAG: TlpA family protein disulfide reductase [Phycisphaerae bacterium]
MGATRYTSIATLGVWLVLQASVGAGAAQDPAPKRADSADSKQAEALYARMIRLYAGAQAIHIEADVVDTIQGTKPTVKKGRLSIRATRPLHGTFRRELGIGEGRVVVHLVADGERVTFLDDAGKTFLDCGDSFSMFCDLLKLDALYAWAGRKVLPPSRLTALPTNKDGADLRGIAVQGVEFRQELWLDRTGRLVRASVIPEGEAPGARSRRRYAVSRDDYTFTTMTLKSKADPKDYAARIPEGYHPMEDPNTEDTRADLLAVGMAAPTAILIDMKDAALPLASFRGKTVLLNFWFYHCFACRQEMPKLDRLWRDISKNRDDVIFLCVGRQDSKRVVRQYWTAEKFALRVARQKGEEVCKAFGVKGFPTNYVIDPAGRVLYRDVGYDEKAIRSALAKTTSKKN